MVKRTMIDMGKSDADSMKFHGVFGNGEAKIHGVAVRRYCVERKDRSKIRIRIMIRKRIRSTITSKRRIERCLADPSLNLAPVF